MYRDESKFAMALAAKFCPVFECVADNDMVSTVTTHATLAKCVSGETIESVGESVLSSLTQALASRYDSTGCSFLPDEASTKKPVGSQDGILRISQDAISGHFPSHHNILPGGAAAYDVQQEDKCCCVVSHQNIGLDEHIYLDYVFPVIIRRVSDGVAVKILQHSVSIQLTNATGMFEVYAIIASSENDGTLKHKKIGERLAGRPRLILHAEKVSLSSTADASAQMQPSEVIVFISPFVCFQSSLHQTRTWFRRLPRCVTVSTCEDVDLEFSHALILFFRGRFALADGATTGIRGAVFAHLDIVHSRFTTTTTNAVLADVEDEVVVQEAVPCLSPCLSALLVLLLLLCAIATVLFIGF